MGECSVRGDRFPRLLTCQPFQLPYSLLWLVIRLPSILPLDAGVTVGRSSARRIHPLMLRLRNFESATLGFVSEVVLTDVFESVKSCIIAREWARHTVQ